MTNRRQAGDNFAVTMSVSGRIRYASVSVEDAGLHENQIPCGELGVVSEEKVAVRSMAELERVEARQYESVMVLPVLQHEWEFES